MNSELRNNLKKRGFKRFVNSFKYSLAGLKYTIKEEQSIVVMLIATITAIIIAFILEISILEWIFIVLAMGIVLAFELMNTAVEATVDLVSPNIHPLAKIAKDTASASVFISSLMAFVIGGFIFIPKIINMIEMGW
ncbi:MAG: diacylglycerol kinase [Bacilli bacterium]|jgi:undecaprenol kinase|nr:diacylglycerol kinase [Bacilli bacterium]